MERADSELSTLAFRTPSNTRTRHRGRGKVSTLLNQKRVQHAYMVSFITLRCILLALYILTAGEEMFYELPMYKMMHALEYGVLHRQ
jgi:hypothetical protein